MNKAFLLLICLLDVIIGVPALIIMRQYNIAILIPLIIILSIILSLSYIYIQVLVYGFYYSDNQNELKIKAKSIKDSGSPIITIKCNSPISIFNNDILYPLLKVTLYPSGIYIKPFLLKEFALFYDDIISVNCRYVIYINKTEIVHKSKLIINPVTLYISEDNSLVKELRRRIGYNNKFS